MNLRIIFLKARLKLFPRFSGKYDFNAILKNAGIHVGDHTIFYDPNSMSIDRQRPWMLHIGDYCKITKGTVILTHDYSRSVLRRKYGEIIGESGSTFIGDNVFVGMNSIILMGSHIGNNCIVGAGSVVSGFFPDDCVIAGNPAKVIHSIEDHYIKMKEREVDAATLYFKSFYNRYNRIPSVAEMGPFFSLFLERSVDAISNSGVNFNFNGDSKEDAIRDFIKTKPKYNGYDAFVSSIMKEKI